MPYEATKHIVRVRDNKTNEFIEFEFRSQYSAEKMVKALAECTSDLFFGKMTILGRGWVNSENAGEARTEP